MDHQGSSLNSGNKISASKDEMKTSLLSQLDYDSSGSETHSSVPSPQSGGPPNDIFENFSLPPDIEMDAISVIPTAGTGPSSQGDILDNSFVEWIADVNCMLPSFPDSIPQLEPNSMQPTFSVDPFRNTTAYHLDNYNVSNTQNQSNFAVDATLPTSSFLPSMIDTGHHDQFVSSFYPTSDVPSSSSLGARAFSFTDDSFPASDLYADLVNANCNYGNALDAEIWFQPHLYGTRTMDLDPAQQPTPFDQPEQVSMQNNLVQSMSNADIPEASFFGNMEQPPEALMSMHPMPGQADTLKNQAKDPGNTNSDAQTAEHQYQIPELLKALEASRQEVNSLKNELYSVSKKYNNLKKSCDEIRESRRTYKAQIETLIQNNRKLEEKIKLDEQNKQTALQEIFEEHKTRILGSLTMKKAEVQSVLTRIQSRQRNFIKERQMAWERKMQADNAVLQSTMPASDGETFRSINTTRENIRARHQDQARFGNGNTCQQIGKVTDLG